MSQSIHDQLLQKGLVKPEDAPQAKREAERASWAPVEEKGSPPPFEAPASGRIVERSRAPKSPGRALVEPPRVVKIWIDGDAMPSAVKEIVLRAAERLRVEAVLVANKDVGVGRGQFATFVRVGKGSDVADAYIAARAARGDLCVTADIPLAALLVEAGVEVIDPRGDVYSESNVGERLAIRDFMASLREGGTDTGGPPPFDAKARQRFAQRFDQLVTRAVRRT